MGNPCQRRAADGPNMKDPEPLRNRSQVFANKSHSFTTGRYPCVKLRAIVARCSNPKPTLSIHPLYEEFRAISTRDHHPQWLAQGAVVQDSGDANAQKDCYDSLSSGSRTLGSRRMCSPSHPFYL
jgi:hypothetical protein